MLRKIGIKFAVILSCKSYFLLHYRKHRALWKKQGPLFWWGGGGGGVEFEVEFGQDLQHLYFSKSQFLSLV